jgi:hypothetical protein
MMPVTPATIEAVSIQSICSGERARKTIGILAGREGNRTLAKLTARRGTHFQEKICTLFLEPGYDAVKPVRGRADVYTIIRSRESREKKPTPIRRGVPLIKLDITKRSSRLNVSTGLD